MRLLKPLMVYDGDCGFCRRWIGRWKKVTADAVEYEPYQTAAGRFPQTPEAEFQKAVYLFEPNGRVTHGAEAVFRSLSTNRFLKWLPFFSMKVPFFLSVSEKIYQWIARNRSFLSQSGSCGLSQADEAPTYFSSRWFFLKCLALANLFAFWSLRGQLEALVGSQGIEPVLRYLKGGSFAVFFSAPTLLWFCPTDGFLNGLCDAGIILSVLLFLGFIPWVGLAALWISYLSLTTVGGDFLSFQWDNLLLECDALALFLVPFGWRLRRFDSGPIPGFSILIFKWLLFRLMVSSALVKLFSGDPAWRHLTALSFHYETQPLPTPLAWWAHLLPPDFQIVSCLFMFGVELVVPFLIWGPRRFQAFAFGPLVLLQLLIALTGNYCFFNLLTLGLCFFALEDAAWPLSWKNFFLQDRPSGRKSRYLSPWIRIPFLGAVLLVSGVQLLAIFGWTGLEQSLAPVESVEAPFRSVNAYGLFAVMTTTRREIIVEGSQDGKNWLPYEFKYKPGDPSKAPAWVAPFQPRLDWQMWFAALGRARDDRWFISFLVRLLEGSPKVTGLLQTNPFAAGPPPRFIRAEIYDYHFTDRAQKAQTGNFWVRDNPQVYMPPFSLADVK
jgi:predicted DCC family thiol-disulfide oxidoreductase YuxK